MTLNVLERRNSPYFAFFPNSTALQGDYVTVIEGIMSAKYRLLNTLGQNWHTLQRSLSAIGELLVSFDDNDDDYDVQW